MDLKQELSAMLSAFAQGSLPKEETVDLLVRDVSTRQQLLAHPRVAEELALRANMRSGLTCSQVEELLPGHIDAGRSGQARSAGNKHLKRHLRLCPECYEVYYAAVNILEAQASGVLQGWPQTTTFAPASTILIPRAEIQRRLTSLQRHHTMRGHGTQGLQQMLYAGAVQGHPDLFASVIAAQTKEVWQITVSLRGAGAFIGRQVSLTVGDESRTTYADPQGTARFMDIPTHWILSPSEPDLQISL